MITEEMVRIYQRYNGDIDGFSRARRSAEHKIISDQEWTEIDQLLQRLFIEKAGLAAESFSQHTAQLLSQRVLPQSPNYSGKWFNDHGQVKAPL